MYSCKVVVIIKNGCIREIGCFRAKVVVFGQNCCIRARWLYSGKTGCIRSKWLYLSKRWLYSVKVVVFGQKVVVFGQSGCIREKVFVFGQN